jgi:4,5-dihydroxyphthalate decarboxylase
MSKPRLTLALSLYDRHVPFFDGTATVNDVDLQVLAVGEANSLRDGGRRHHRMLMNLEFDACEVSLSSYIIARHHGLPIIAIPVFPRRLFTQSNVWVNRDTGIRTPKELIGRKVGLITFQTTVSVQAKGDLQAEYGVPWRDIEWYVAAEEPIEFSIPDGLILKRIPQGKRLGEMLETGLLDAVITPRAPVSVVGSTATIRRLFPMAQDEECRYFRKHAFFPAMHVVALKEETVQKYPWVPAALVRAFQQAHEICRSYYTDPNWTVHAWTQHLFEEEQNRLGLNLWPIGIEENRPNIELFMQYLMDQGLVPQNISLEKLFVDGSHDGK